MALLRTFFSIAIPPLGVFLVRGAGGAFWLNVLLTLLGYLPGVAHTLWIRRSS
jgi:uncharacterized membrane protein YqaE (UPF0057 family)